MLSNQSTSASDSESLEDLRTQYEKALSRNRDARRHLAQLHSANVTSRDLTGATIDKNLSINLQRQKHLEAQLDNLRLQKQQQNLQSLQQFSQEAEQIGNDEKIFDALDLGHYAALEKEDFNPQTALTVAQHHLDGLANGTKALTTNLELALVKARQQLKLEQNSLRAQGSHLRTRQNGSSDRTESSLELHAMEATRRELQRWIEESLVRCEQCVKSVGEDPPDLETLGLTRHEDETDALIEAEYERYLRTRLQVVHLARALKTSRPDTGSRAPTISTQKLQTELSATIDDQKHKISLQRAPHLRHKSRMSVNKMMEQSGGPALAKLESTAIPEYHHEKLLSTYMAHLDAQTAGQDTRLLQVLGLLSHESHLLPSYPLPSMEDTHPINSDDLSQQRREIGHLLHAWAHASQTADMVLMDNVLGNVEDSRSALQRARQCVNEMHVMEQMRKEVASGKR